MNYSLLEHEISTGWIQVPGRGKRNRVVKWAAGTLPGRPCSKVVAGAYKSTAGTYNSKGKTGKRRNPSNRVKRA